MEYEETCSQGSFTVWGSGFRYNYESENNLINIALLNKKRAIAQLKLDTHLAKNPLAYVEALNKTHQIKALMYSNNATVDMSEAMDSEHIASLIKTTARVSRFAYDLDTKNFERFCSVFAKDFNLKNVKIKKFFSRQKNKNIYLARIQTEHNNSICVRGCCLTNLTAALSNSTLSDLITMEFGHNYNNSAQNLLSASSRLSTISRILDENFIPQNKLDEYKTHIESMKSA